jgi:hypothetical protein
MTVLVGSAKALRVHLCMDCAQHQLVWGLTGKRNHGSAVVGA